MHYNCSFHSTDHKPGLISYTEKKTHPKTKNNNKKKTTKENKRKQKPHINLYEISMIVPAN